MKIFYQIQSNDCGVAVTKSLIQHFYKVNVPYSLLFAKAQINQNGLNLLNFENLNNLFGLKVESYACELVEFFTLPEKNYYVILRQNEQWFHYCIVYKVTDRNVVYDPNDKVKILKNHELAKIFAGIVLTVEKKWKKFQPIEVNNFPNDEKQLFKNLLKSNWEDVFLATVISTLTIILTIVNSQTFKFILSGVIIANQLQNLSSTFIFFVMTIILEILLLFALRFLQEKIIWKIYAQLSHDLKNKLISSTNFFGRIDESIIFQMPNCIHTIAHYVTNISTSVINQIIFSTFMLFLLPKISVYFLIVFVLMVSFDLIFDAVCYWWSRENKWESQKITDVQIRTWKKLIDYLKTEHDVIKQQNICADWKTNLTNQSNFYQEANFFNNKISSIRKFIQSSLNLLSLVLGSILIVKFNKITLADLLSSTFVLGFFMTYCGGISKSVFSFNFFRVQALRFLNCISLPEKPQSGEEKWPEQITEIKLNHLVWSEPEIEHWKTQNYQIKNDTVIFGQNGIGKSTLCQTMTGKILLASGDILINDKSLYDYAHFADQIVLINSKSPLDQSTYEKLVEHLDQLNEFAKPMIINYLDQSRLWEVKSLENLSSGQRQILNWLYLITFQNKLIICDEALNFIQHEQKIQLLELTKSMIIQQNFLMVVEHDQSIRNLFKNELQLHQV